MGFLSERISGFEFVTGWKIIWPGVFWAVTICYNSNFYKFNLLCPSARFHVRCLINFLFFSPFLTTEGDFLCLHFCLHGSHLYIRIPKFKSPGSSADFTFWKIHSERISSSFSLLCKVLKHVNSRILNQKYQFTIKKNPGMRCVTTFWACCFLTKYFKFFIYGFG